MILGIMNTQGGIMDIITQTLLSLTLTEVAKIIGVNMLLILLLILVLVLYKKENYKFSKLEISLIIMISFLYLIISFFIISLEDLKELCNLQKQMIEKQENIIIDYRKTTQNLLQNLESLDNKFQLKLEIQELKKHFSEGLKK